MYLNLPVNIDELQQVEYDILYNIWILLHLLILMNYTSGVWYVL